MEKEIYLDNSATTRVAEEAAELMVRIMTADYGNPSSLHNKGIEAERYLRGAKETLAEILKCDTSRLFFTSGGTESDNWAIFSGARANQRKGRRLITSAIEHPAVAEPMKELERQGFEVITIPVDGQGVIDTTALGEALNEGTILVSIMLVNNEVGSIQPVEQISSLIKQKAPKALFHVDGVQAFGKLRIHPRKMGIDLLSVSGHKLHGPKGSGLLYVSEGAKLNPFIYGGGQQKHMRSGTENVPGIAGLGKAAELAYANFDEDIKRLYELKDYFAAELAKLPEVRLNGPAGEARANAGIRIDAPHIINASFMGVRSEVLLHSLEEQGIYVSAGSACSSHKQTGSDTLRAMGLDKERMGSALRFSFSTYTTKEELQTTLEALSNLLPKLRRFTRR